MQDFSFSLDLTAVIILLCIGVLFFIVRSWSKIFSAPHIKFSDLSTLKSGRPPFREKFFRLPYILLLLSLALFALAFVDPHYYVRKKNSEKNPPPANQRHIPTEGIAIYLILDRSGSMSHEINAINSNGFYVTTTKMNLLKQLTEQFVEGNPKIGLKGRPNDLIGVVAFARGAEVLVPLTLDHQAVLTALKKLTYITSPERNATAIGYAIFKTANLIAATRHYAEELSGKAAPAYQIKSNVMILITDGFQAPSSLDKTNALRNIDLVDAANYARKNHIKLYIINVEPSMASDEFALDRKLQRQVAELTGGKFYLIDRSGNLGKIYRDIDRLEKSPLPVEAYLSFSKKVHPYLYRRISFYPYLIALGMLLMAFSIFLETVLMRRVP